MGLGGSRKRTKLSHDPNNTNWTQAIDKYGQRVLESQGWVPGASLGAQNKPYTRPRGISHIRVALKDDNLGLGARRGAPDVLHPGLDAFQGLLGRLNGKSDAVLATEQESRSSLRMANYVEQRWGPMRFVSGGLLVGDHIEEAQKGQRADSALGKKASSTSPKPVESTPKATEATQETTVADAFLAASTAKKTEKSKKRKKDRTQAEADQILDTKAKSCDTVSAAPFESIDNATAVSALQRTLAEEKAQKRAEKAQRKLERRSRKETKSARKETLARAGEGQADTDHRRAQEECTTATIGKDTRQPPLPRSHRQVARQRYIQQKKMALADPRALNEILMVKG